MTTLHANRPKDSLNRLETMVLIAGMEIPIKAIREYIANAIDLVVTIERMNDGKRKITSITELVGFEDDRIKLRKIFTFNQMGITDSGDVNGEFVLYDIIPKVLKKIEARGINDLDDMFRKS